jgi:hypothetical protein
MELKQATRHYASLQLETADVWLNRSSVLARCHDGQLTLLTRSRRYDPEKIGIIQLGRPGSHIVLSPCGHYVIATWPRSTFLRERIAAQIMQLTVPPLLKTVASETRALAQSCCAVSISGCLAHFAYDRSSEETLLNISHGSRTPRTLTMPREFLCHPMLFSADGAWLFLLMASHTIVVVDTDLFTWTQIEASDKSGVGHAVAASANGENYLVVPSWSSIAVYRVRRDGTQVHATLSNEFENRVVDLYANPHAGHVVVRRMPADKVSSVIDVASGVEHPWWGLPDAQCACISDDGRLLAAGNHVETHIYIAQPGSAALYTVQYDDLAISCFCNSMLAFHDNGKALFFSTRNHGLRLTRVPPVHDQLARMLSRMIKSKDVQMPSYWLVAFILSGITQ